MTQKAQDIDDLKGHLVQDIDDPITFVKILILSIVKRQRRVSDGTEAQKTSC